MNAGAASQGDAASRAGWAPVAPAQEADLEAICALLTASGLPTAGVADHLTGFLVVRDAGRIVATAGLEDHGDACLLRSVAVAPAYRGRGLGRTLVMALLESARARRHAEVYLLTDTAAGYFRRFGFQPTAREAVRPSVQRSAEFRIAACASSVVMVRPLELRPLEGGVTPPKQPPGER